MKAELVTSDRTKLTPDNEDDIVRRISHPNASGTHYPIPFPTKKAKGGVSSKEMDEIQSAQFRAKAVEPRSSQIGFLFFDVSDISNPLAGARFYLTGVRNSSGNDLMYFEVPLDKYLENRKPHSPDHSRRSMRRWLPAVRVLGYSLRIPSLGSPRCPSHPSG